MEPQLCIYVCGAFYPEVSSIIYSGKYPDVVIRSFPCDCVNPAINRKNFYSAANESLNDYSKVIVIGGSCNKSNKSAMGNHRRLTFYDLDYCMELFLNKELLNHFIGEKKYLVSNGWLTHYKQHIINWGFEAETAKRFFGESADTILLLETGIQGNYEDQIEALSQYMGLPYEILPVGLSHCSREIENLIFKWREENERNQMSVQIAEISKKNADNSLVYEQILRLVDLTDETQIVRQIFILLDMLFSPKNISYTPLINKVKGEAILLHSDIPADSEKEDNSLTIDVIHQGKITGVFRVLNVAFAEYIEKYQPMKEVISKMSGLAIANSRKYRTISDNEDQLKRNKIELIELNDTKDKFFSIIAHDIKNPLGTFMGYTKMLAEENQAMTRDEIKDIAGTLMESSTNLFRLLENLLEWSRMQRGITDSHPEQLLLLSRIKEGIILILDTMKKKSIEIDYNIPDNQMVFADRHMFDTVIRNLVSNAVKFTLAGGKVNISAFVKSNGFVEIQVKDSGIGMPAELTKKLFVMNENTSRKGTDGESGTGLGLLLCKEFIHKNGGEIWVNSEEGKGSTFTFTIPYK